MKTWIFKVTRYFFAVIIFGLLLAACPWDSPIPTPTSPPATPTNLEAKATSSTSIAVKWGSVSGATGYDVYCQIGTASMLKLSTVTGTSYNHTGLQPNTDYSYYVSATNSAGTSDLSSRASAKTPLNDAGGTKPAAPTGVTVAVESLSSIRITWNLVAGASSYDVYYAIGSSSADNNFAASVNNPPYIHTGLQQNTTYYYSVKAKNSAGESPLSSYASVKISNDIPQAPSGVAASTISSDSIRVTWNPVSGVTGYNVYYEIGSSTTRNFYGSVTAPPFTHTGLQPNTTYYYYVKATNSAGESGFSSPASAKTASISKPSAPTGVTAVLDSSNNIRITWYPVSGATAYNVYYEIGWSTTKNLAGTVTNPPFTHTGLQPNTTYYYYITATNSAGESNYSSSINITTPATDTEISPPSAPTGVTAATVSSGSIRVTWNPVSNATSYDIHYEIGSSTTKNFARNVTSPPYTHTGLQPDTTYNYYIIAKNSAGGSIYSSPASAKTSTATLPVAPTGVTGTPSARGTSVIVTWNTVSGATSYKVYYGDENSTNLKYSEVVNSSTFTHNLSSRIAAPTTPTTTKTYRYQVSAINSVGEGPPSSVATVTW